MKILIIGGTGFIGEHLVRELKHDHEIFLFHRGHSKDKIVGTQSIIAHRRELPKFRKNFEEIQPDLVIDLIPYFAQDAWDVLRSFRQICSKVIVISSGDVYRAYEIFKDNLQEIISGALSEESELRSKLFPYRGSQPDNYLFQHYDKILVENIMLQQKEFDYTILRLGALYGEYDRQRKLKEHLEPMLNGKSKIQIPKEKAHWRWTRAYVGNVVKGIKLVLEKETESKNQIYNLGYTKALSQLELLQKLKTLTHWTGSIELLDEASEEGFNYKQHLILDSFKIRRDLGFVENYTLAESLGNTINFEKSLLQND